MDAKTKLRWIFLAVFVMSPPSLASAQALNLARNEKAAEQAIAALLIADIYQRAGLSVRIQPLPAARANAMMLAGSKDGEVARVQSYATKNPDLIKVEPAYYYLTTTAFAKVGKGITIKSRDDLKKYTVGMVRGIAHAQTATEGVPTLEVVGDYEQLYQMLDAGRIDVAVDTGVNGQYTIRKMDLKGIKAVGDLAKLELFTMLAPGKKEYAARISASIQALKSSGALAKLARRYEDQFMKSDVAP